MLKTSKILLLCFVTLLFSCSSDNDENPLDTDETPPSLQITFAGIPEVEEDTPIVVSKQLEVKIDAEDANGIEKIEAFIDDEKVGEDTTPPFEITIDVSGFSSKLTNKTFKDYILKVIATDKAGNTASKEQIFNVDNELPAITGVSLSEDTILQGNENLFTFNVSDNEGIPNVKLYINENLISEIEQTTEIEANLETSNLSDGQNILRIEAIDQAENTVNFEVNFIADNTGPEITLENITEDMIIYESLTINPVANDEFSEVTFVEVKFNENTLLNTDSPSGISYQFDPENQVAGKSVLTIIAKDNLENTTTLDIPVNIHRKLITINIPENRLNPAIIIPVVFISKMDGTLLVSKEILREDRQIVLSTEEEFDINTEFMLSFYLQDNGNAVGISTHQSLTRVNPGVINLKEPVRPDVGVADDFQIPTTNFFSNDNLFGNSGLSRGTLRSFDDAVADYSIFLDNDTNILNISRSATPENPDPFESFYIYDPNSYNYSFINTPIDPSFIFDKSNLSDANLETRSYTVNSQNALPNNSSYFVIYGATSDEDNRTGKYHQIYTANIDATLNSTREYTLNTSFSFYRHGLLFGNYFTERKGIPANDYQIPNLTFDYTFANNEINLSVQGNDHVLGRAQCIDFDNPNYNWYITFDSNNTKVIIPELPANISHPVATAHSNGNIKVESVELLSFESINTYDNYIDSVVKNQENILEVTDWYQMIYSSRSGGFNAPNREFVFQ